MLLHEKKLHLSKINNQNPFTYYTYLLFVTDNISNYAPKIDLRHV